MSENGSSSPSKIIEHLKSSQHKTVDEIDACPSRARKRNAPSVEPQTQDGREYIESDGDMSMPHENPH